MTRYGYIGLGMMGSAMTEHLVSTGAEVTVFDLDEAAVARAVDQGAAAAPSAADVARASDIVSICVPAAAHIQTVLSGAGGIAEGAHAGLSILIHSTVHPDTMTAARDTAAAWDVALFDACVAGGNENARAGTLVIFAGGADTMAAEVRALLDIYGSRVIDAGPVGSGAALKVGVNVMTFAQMAAAHAAFDLVGAAGADTNALIEAWRHIGMLGELTDRFTPMLAFSPEDITGDFRESMVTQLGIAQKDLELALALGDAGAGPSSVVRAIHDEMPDVYRVGRTP